MTLLPQRRRSACSSVDDTPWSRQQVLRTAASFGRGTQAKTRSRESSSSNMKAHGLSSRLAALTRMHSPLSRTEIAQR